MKQDEAFHATVRPNESAPVQRGCGDKTIINADFAHIYGTTPIHSGARNRGCTVIVIECALSYPGNCRLLWLLISDCLQSMDLQLFYANAGCCKCRSIITSIVPCLTDETHTHFH